MRIIFYTNFTNNNNVIGLDLCTIVNNGENNTFRPYKTSIIKKTFFIINIDNVHKSINRIFSLN